MSRFLSEKYISLKPYVPGEQPGDKRYIKLNTNESPYPPSPKAIQIVTQGAAEGLKLYSDPVARKLRKAISSYYGLDESEVVATNGSDEALCFAFMAYLGSGEGIAFPDISYGFYKVLRDFLGVRSEVIPLKEDFTIDVEAFCKTPYHVVIANPNAPTGIPLSLEEVERIVATNLARLVIIDEAYTDFWGKTSIPLIKKYDNLLVVQTFSKSRSLAGARIGFAAGNRELMRDIDRVRDCVNPYNINTLSEMLGVAAIEDTEYFSECVAKTVAERDRTAKRLTDIGFEVLPSAANFLFARHKDIGGKQMYLSLKEEGVLVRHFDVERIKDFARISIGNSEEMNVFMVKTLKILEGVKKK